MDGDSVFEATLASLAPGVASHSVMPGLYYPRKGLAIYYLPIPGYSPAAPGTSLGEALSARSGLGCTLLEGVPAKVPDGAVVIANYKALRAIRPDLVHGVPAPVGPGSYAIRISNHAVIVSETREGLAHGMQTLAMIVLRHGEEAVPGTVIVDKPFCQQRGLAVEVNQGELGVNFLMQIASFAATFKANRLHLILEEDFNPAVQVPGIDVFFQTCRSHGLAIGIRLPWLKKILNGEKTLVDAWAGIRSTARLFGATIATLDDPCPEGTPREQALRIVTSLLRGEVGMESVGVDAGLLAAAGADPAEVRAFGVYGWHRMRDESNLPGHKIEDYPLQVDVQATLPGFSAATSAAYHARLDAAIDWLSNRAKRDIVVSFRDIGISHLWQNLLLPSATGLITTWGIQRRSNESANLFAELLYGDMAQSVIAAWDAVTSAFPPGLSKEEETLVRQTAFGRWPETEHEHDILASIDWLEQTRHIRVAADTLKNVAETLSRNAVTLVGAKLALHAISWLHCFIALAPELIRRRRAGFDGDGRTEPIATELFNNFSVWHTYLLELQDETGLEFAEMPLVESMGARLRELCEPEFEDEAEPRSQS